MANVPYYSFAQYKTLAAQYLKKFGLPKDNLPPVDIEVLLDKAGIQVHPVIDMSKDFAVSDLRSCAELWKRYSGSVGATWSPLPDSDTDLWLSVKQYLAD